MGSIVPDDAGVRKGFFTNSAPFWRFKASCLALLCGGQGVVDRAALRAVSDLALLMRRCQTPTYQRD
jgi:hypothetical protein